MNEEPTRKMPAQPHDVAPPGYEDPPSGNGGGSKTAIVIGALLAAIAGVVIAVLLISDGDDKAKTVTSTAPTVTTTTTTETTDTTTTTEGIGQVTAENAAQAAASDTADQGGINIPPDDFDAKCTAEGGTSTASTWNCNVTSSSGQCSGPVTVEATADGGTAIQENQVACGE